MPRTTFLLNSSEDRLETLQEVAFRASLTQSELLRRMMDYCFREPVLNELVPSMSGQMSVCLR